MLRASSLGLRLSRSTVCGPGPCFTIRRVRLAFMVLGTAAPRLFSQSVLSRRRLVGKSKRDERTTTVFSQNGRTRYPKEHWKELPAQGVNAIPRARAAVVGLAVHQGMHRVQDLAQRKLPRFIRTFRHPYILSKVKASSTSSLAAAIPGTRIAMSRSIQLHQSRRRASHNGVKGNVRAVVKRNNPCVCVMQAEGQVTVGEIETWKGVEPKEVQVPAETAKPTCTDSPLDCHITETPYPTGLPWRHSPIKTLRLCKVENDVSLYCHLSIELEAWYRSLLRTLATTQSVSEAWEAYTNLLELPSDVPAGKPRIPFAHMHRLFRVLARHRPKTRTQFLRLLSLVIAIRESGGEVKLHEWNALMDVAGKGWRKTSIDDFRTALGIFQDMISGRAPGKSLARDQGDERELFPTPPIEPDIYTYTTLISLASRTLHAPAFRHATSLLAASGLPPNRITHLSLLRYFTLTKQLSGVRSTLFKMQEQNLELGLDGINACLWSYGQNGRVDLVMMIYRLFRHNIVPEVYVGQDDVASIARRLRIEECIIIPPDMKPNEVTFTTVIQILAHHGNLLATLTVFMDMVSSQNLEMGAPLVPDENGVLKPTPYSPTLPVFRAIFLGFSRHGIRLMKDGTVPPRFRATSPPGQPTWSLTNLQTLFDTFLELPEHIIPSRSTVYWIMVAFAKTSGNDVALLRRVWKQLKSRFKGPWGGSNNRLRRIQARLFPEEVVRVDKNGHKI